MHIQSVIRIHQRKQPREDSRASEILAELASGGMGLGYRALGTFWVLGFRALGLQGLGLRVEGGR